MSQLKKIPCNEDLAQPKTNIVGKYFKKEDGEYVGRRLGLRLLVPRDVVVVLLLS